MIDASMPDQVRSIFASSSRQRMRARARSHVRSEILISRLPTISFSRSLTLSLTERYRCPDVA
jgi:hypothetical protein